MMYKNCVLICAILVVGLKQAHSTSTVICPDQQKAVELLGTVNISAPAQPFTQHIRSGRLPPFGLYDEGISCIIIVDTTYDVSPGTVQVIGGGLNQRFVEIKIISKVGKSIDYVAQAYSAGSNLAQKKSSRIH